MASHRTASAVAAEGPAPGEPPTSGEPPAWSSVRERLHDLGLRWTPQRRTVVEVLSRADGHVTGAELVERCRELDPETTPSTVYRTLDVLEDLGLVRHSHGAAGREEFHVLPAREHGHLTCRDCGTTWEIDATEGAALVQALRSTRGFAIDLSHLSIVGRCRACADRLGAGEIEAAGTSPGSGEPADPSG